jgi:hypothetical protein
MLWGFEDFKQANDVIVANLLENVDFLCNFLLRVRVLQVGFVDGFDGDIPPR